MAAQAPSPTSPLDFAAARTATRRHPPAILPSRTLAARLRLLLSDRSRFTQSLARESEALSTAANALLASPASLFDSSAAPRLADSLTGAWHLEAQITADLCDAPITPLDGEDIRALASSATAILEALDDLHAAAQLATHAAAQAPLGPLCRAALESVEAVAGLLSDPLVLARDESRLPILSSRDRALRAACRAAESSLLQSGTEAHVRLLLEWTLLGAFRRLRSRLRAAVGHTQRAVLKNS
ncbi:MAG: hypothetical protein ABI972_27745 [Acidobacteriota bacterium]